MRHLYLLLTGALLVLFLANACSAQTTPKPAASPGQASSAAVKSIFQNELTNTTGVNPEDISAQLQDLIKNTSAKLDGIQASISKEIETIERAEEVFRKAVAAVSDVAEKLAPDSIFNKSLDNLKQSALKFAQDAANSHDPDVQKQTDEFKARAREFEERKADAAVEYQKALNTVANLNSKKDLVVNKIRLNAYAAAASLAHDYINQARVALGTAAAITPPSTAPQAKDKVSH